MKREVEVAIIGAGTAGLSARSQVQKKTDNYVIIDDGPLGTTCARVGCMPSKVLIEVANTYHKRHKFSELGIEGAEHIKVDKVAAMQHVRKLRDRFVRSVRGSMTRWEEEKLIRKRATFIDRNTLDLGDEQIHAKSIIIAAGPKPIMPAAWEPYRNYFIDTDQFFELEKLPESIAVIGLGVIGIELGQALSRLGVKVHAFSSNKAIGGLSDPKIQDYAAEYFEKEFPIEYGRAEIIGEKDGKLQVKSGNKTVSVDKAFLTMGRAPSLKGLGIDNIDVPLDNRGIPEFSNSTFQIPNTRIFIAGDVNADRPILHEAADQGNIAGHNAVLEDSECFRRRESLGIVFSDPNIASVGMKYAELKDKGIDFITGDVSFEGYGRAIVMLKEVGLLHIYADSNSGKLLGAEMMAPAGEHMAHMLSWVINLGLSVRDVVALPYYHPVIEEGLLTAFRELANKLESGKSDMELLRCEEPLVSHA